MANTSGTNARAARELDRLVMRFDLVEELARLRDEPAGNDPDRQTITLAKAGTLRVVLTALAAGTQVGADETNGALSIQALRGAITLERDGHTERLETEQLAVLDRGSPWRATADEDSALLITLSWPEDAPGRLGA